jgi:hypothetical protein
MKWHFISIVSFAIIMVWALDVSGQDASDVEAVNKQVLQLYQQGEYAPDTRAGTGRPTGGQRMED